MEWNVSCTPNLNQCRCDINMCACRCEKMSRVRCAVHTPRRLQQTAVSCKRSNCNEINLKKLDESRTSEVLSKDGNQRVTPFYLVALHVSSFVDFLWIFMSSTRNRSIATNWKKNSMIGASIDTSRMAQAWVVVLQILGVDGLMWSTHRWSQNDLSMVRIFQNHWEISTNSFCIDGTLLASYDMRNLFAQARPSGCTKFSIFQKPIVDPFTMTLDASLSHIMGNMTISLFWSFPISMAMRSSLLNDIILNWEKVQCTLNGTSVGFTFFQEMSSGAIDDALTPVQ